MESGSVVKRFGKFHVINFFLTCLPAVFNAASNVNFVIVTSDTNYRCRVPECEKPNQDFIPPWWPKSMDRCSKPIINGTIEKCSNSSFSSLDTCTEWIYESNNSMISELDLACQPMKLNMIGTIHNIAMATSMFLSGRVADWLGRKPVLIFCSVSLIIGVFKTISPSYYVYIAIEFFEGLGAGGVVTVGLIIMIEIANKKNRLLASVLFGCAIYLGEVLFASLAIVIPNWRNLFYIVYIPPLLFLLYIPFSKETLRWLIVHERTDEAKQLVKTIVRMNKVDISPGDIDAMDLNKLQTECDVESVMVTEGYREAFRSCELVKRFLIGVFCRFTVVFIYYGLTVNSVSLPGNKNMNFLLTSLISCPGDVLCLFLLNKFGRKMPLISGYILCGILCVVYTFVPPEMSWLKILVYLAAKLVVAACYTGAVTYTIELFPTSVRGSLLGMCTVFASLGTTLAPLTPSVSPIVLSICFCSSAIISSVLLWFVPETNKKKLVDTVKQLENMMHDKRGIKMTYRMGRDNMAFDN